MGSVGCLAKGDICFWQNILKNRSKYTGDISEWSVVCTVLILTIIVEIFRRRKNIPNSYIIPYKKLASPLIPVCLKKSYMFVDAFYRTVNLKKKKKKKHRLARGRKVSRTLFAIYYVDTINIAVNCLSSSPANGSSIIPIDAPFTSRPRNLFLTWWGKDQSKRQ